MRIALAIICHQRQAELEVALASAAAEVFDEVVVADMASAPALTVPEGVRLVRSERNLGVAGGRNRLVAETTADVVVFMDDDAVLAPGARERVAARFAGDPRLGLVAFRIERPEGIERWEQPFRPGFAIPDAPTPCAYFVGAGHAVRRSAYLEAGGYDERLFYATQEQDLAFKLLRCGWQLEYDPAVRVEHRPSPKGRAPASNLPAMLLHDRLLVTRTHLPAPVAALHSTIWAGLTLRDAARVGGLGHWRRGLGAGLRAPVDRRPLAWRTVREVHRRGGRALY